MENDQVNQEEETSSAMVSRRSSHLGKLHFFSSGDHFSNDQSTTILDDKPHLLGIPPSSDSSLLKIRNKKIDACDAERNEEREDVTDSGTEDDNLSLDCPSNEEEIIPNIEDADTAPVLEYVEDIFRALREDEEKIPNFINPKYMRQHSDLTPENRANLVDWMIGVQEIFRLEQETLFLSVTVFNIFLSNPKSIGGEWDLRLVAIAALLIAWKYEEVDLPDVSEFARYIAADFTVAEIESMEASVSMVVQHRLAVPTPYLFLKWFLKAAGEQTLVKNMACFLSELCLFSDMMLEYPPSMLAAAALYHARHLFFPDRIWNKTLQFYTGYQEKELRKCASCIVPSLIEPTIGSLYFNLYQKYSDERYRPVKEIFLATIPL